VKALNQLPEIAARQLGGLAADAQLKARIKLNAAESKTHNYRTTARWQIALSVCAALVLCVGGVLWAMQPATTNTALLPGGSVIDSHPAGNAVVTQAPVTSADLPHGSITMSTGIIGNDTSIFASGQGSSFPLITVGGATYRLLSFPDGISSSLLGTKLGEVSEFNIEPALGSGDIVSNTVGQGSAVYAVNGMDGAMVAAEVGGSLRVFQRVSYAGTATIGGETLEDTLCKPGNVAWMTLSGHGGVEGEAAQELMRILLRDADFQSTGMSGSGSLKIGLTNGLTLQLAVGDDTISACGTWSCPAFFEAFYQIVGW